MATVKKSGPVSTNKPTNINAGKKTAPMGNQLMKKGGKTIKKGSKMC